MGKKTSPSQLNVEQKQIQALNLRLAGVPYDQIAEQLGYASRSGAYAAVEAALDKARSEPAEKLRELMIARLDELLASTWEAALAGDTDAVATVLRIEERRAKLTGIELKDPKVNIKLPPLKDPADATAVVGTLLERVASGELPAEVAGKMAGLVQSYMKISETTELAERIAKLEEIQNEAGTAGSAFGGGGKRITG